MFTKIRIFDHITTSFHNGILSNHPTHQHTDILRINIFPETSRWIRSKQIFRDLISHREILSGGFVAKITGDALRVIYGKLQGNIR